MSDWERLARYLIRRRQDLGYKTRKAFCDHHAMTSGERRTVLELEGGRRSNYEPNTLSWAEQKYGWSVGSVQSVLAGGLPMLSASDTLDAAKLLPEQELRALRRQLDDFLGYTG